MDHKQTLLTPEWFHKNGILYKVMIHYPGMVVVAQGTVWHQFIGISAQQYNSAENFIEPDYLGNLHNPGFLRDLQLLRSGPVKCKSVNHPPFVVNFSKLAEVILAKQNQAVHQTVCIKEKDAAQFPQLPKIFRPLQVWTYHMFLRQIRSKRCSLVKLVLHTFLLPFPVW